MSGPGAQSMGFPVLTDEGVDAEPSFPSFDSFMDKRSACGPCACTCFFCPKAGEKDDKGRDWVWAPFPIPCRTGVAGECCCWKVAQMQRFCWFTNKRKTLMKGKSQVSYCDFESGDIDKCCLWQQAVMQCLCFDASTQGNFTKPKKIKIQEQMCCIYAVCAIPFDDDVKGELGCCGKMIIDKSGGGGGGGGDKVQDQSKIKVREQEGAEAP